MTTPSKQPWEHVIHPATWKTDAVSCLLDCLPDGPFVPSKEMSAWICLPSDQR